MDLFGDPNFKPPLAERMRPEGLSDYFGQTHILNETSPLMNAIRHKRVPSMIFGGPPGVGKTTLARIISGSMGKPFKQLSAIQSGVKEVREVLEFAKARPGNSTFH